MLFHRKPALIPDMVVQHKLQVVLMEPEIPPNTGAIARLCAATGTVLNLVEPLGFKLDDRSLKRAGLDYWHQVTWRTWPNWAALQAANPGAKYYFLTTKGTKSYTEVQFGPADFLVFGRETKGLPTSLLREYEAQCLTIPMLNPGVRSLNLATATAIVLFEALRQVKAV